MVEPVPPHLHTVTPRLVVADGAAAIEFYSQAFGAEEHGDRFVTPEGVVIHAEVRIGDAIVMIAEEPSDSGGAKPAPAEGGPSPTVIMETYWPDVDGVWKRALAAGAEVIFPLDDQFYGDRAGRVRDPFGHQWILSQRIREISPDELTP